MWSWPAAAKALAQQRQRGTARAQYCSEGKMEGKALRQEPSARMASPGSPGSGAATWAVRGSSCHHGLLLGVWGPVAVFFCPCVNFSGCCHGNCQRHGAGGCVTGQLTYDNARIMRSRSLEAESSTTLGLVVLPSPCFCSAAAS